METIEFLVQGSSLEPYKVLFERRESTLAAFCTCAAGDSGQSCKHRLRILNGNSDGVVSDNKDQVSEINKWLKGSNLEAAILEIVRAEADVERTKKILSIAKKKLAVAMHATNV